MYEHSTDHRSASDDAPTRPVPITRRPQPLLSPAPVVQRAPVPVGRLEPMDESISVFDRVEPRTFGLLASMVLGGLLLVAVALVALRAGGDTSTAAGPGFDPAASAALTSDSPALPGEDTAGQFPSSTAAPSTVSSLPVESSTTASTAAPSTTTAPPTTAPVTTAAPTTAPSTTEPSSTSAPEATTTGPSSTTSTTMVSTTATSDPTVPSSETTSSSTTAAPPSTTAAPTTLPTTAGPSGDDGAIQQQVLDATNAERAANGCGPLRLDPLLNRAADGHSEDMAARDYFDHADPEGRGPGVRIDAVGYPHRGWGENIAAGYGSAEAVVTGWMNSPGHRANILNCAFDEIGIGYAEPGRYWTQLFATRR